MVVPRDSQSHIDVGREPPNPGNACEKFDIDEDTAIPKGVALNVLVAVSAIVVAGEAEVLAGSARV